MKKMVDQYNRRRQPGDTGFPVRWGCPAANRGARFTPFPISGPPGLSSEDFAQLLLKEEKVAVVPGNAFGDQGGGFRPLLLIQLPLTT
jgi:aminotransferase